MSAKSDESSQFAEKGLLPSDVSENDPLKPFTSAVVYGVRAVKNITNMYTIIFLFTVMIILFAAFLMGITNMKSHNDMIMVISANLNDSMFGNLSQEFPHMVQMIKPVYNYEKFNEKIATDILDMVNQEEIGTPPLKVIGTVKAHISALISFLKSDEAKVALILEDSTLFHPETNQEISMSIIRNLFKEYHSNPDFYEMVYLGWCKNKDKPYKHWENSTFTPYQNTAVKLIKITQTSYTKHPIYCLHGYLVTKSAAETIITWHNTFSNMDEQIPAMIQNHKLNAAYLHQPIFYQDWQLYNDDRFRDHSVKERNNDLNEKFFILEWVPFLLEMRREGFITRHQIPSIGIIQQYIGQICPKMNVSYVEDYDQISKLNLDGCVSDLTIIITINKNNHKHLEIFVRRVRQNEELKTSKILAVMLESDLPIPEVKSEYFDVYVPNVEDHEALEREINSKIQTRFAIVMSMYSELIDESDLAILQMTLRSEPSLLAAGGLIRSQSKSGFHINRPCYVKAVFQKKIGFPYIRH